MQYLEKSSRKRGKCTIPGCCKHVEGKPKNLKSRYGLENVRFVYSFEDGLYIRFDGLFCEKHERNVFFEWQGTAGFKRLCEELEIVLKKAMESRIQNGLDFDVEQIARRPEYMGLFIKSLKRYIKSYIRHFGGLKDHVLHNFKKAGLDASYEFTFGNFKINESNKLLFEYMGLFSRGYYDKGFFITGNPGIGKSHLMEAAARVLTVRKFDVKFITFSKFIEDEIEAFKPPEGNTYFDRYKITKNDLLDCDVLFIDDLNSLSYGNKTSFGERELDSIIVHRHKKKLPVVISSNKDLKELEQAIGKTFGEKIVSRICEMCHPVRYSDFDHRIDTNF